MVGTFINVGTVLAGTVIGTAIGPRLPERYQQRVLAGLGMITLIIGADLAQRILSRSEHSTVSEGFVSASLLFCVGSLTVVGSIEDGLTGDYQTLATKAVLDGFAAIALSAALGWGVGLSIVTILVVQGGITLGAGVFDDLLVGEALAVLTSAGGITIIGIALKLLDLKDVKVGNFLPALVIAPALVGLVSLF